MAVLSGIAGAVDGVDTVGRWTVNHAADLQAIFASNTKEGPVVLDGNLDWSGSWQSKKSTPDHMPGDAVTFKGSIDGTNGATGTVIIDAVEIEVDIEAGAAIACTVEFSRNGALTLGVSAASDATVPDPPTSIGCKAALGTAVAVPVWTDISDVRSWRLRLERDNQAYVSSDTSGGNLRLAGNLSGTIVVAVYEDDFADLPAVNSHSYIRLYVTATTYWDIGFVIWGEASDITVDREAAAIVGATMNGQWTGFADVDGNATEGYIKKPGDVSWWPA
jgi:hypothetical protein